MNEKSISGVEQYSMTIEGDPDSGDFPVYIQNVPNAAGDVNWIEILDMTETSSTYKPRLSSIRLLERRGKVEPIVFTLMKTQTGNWILAKKQKILPFPSVHYISWT